MDGGWTDGESMREMIVTVKFARRRAEVMGVPKLPDAFGRRLWLVGWEFGMGVGGFTHTEDGDGFDGGHRY